MGRRIDVAVMLGFQPTRKNDDEKRKLSTCVTKICDGKNRINKIKGSKKKKESKHQTSLQRKKHLKKIRIDHKQQETL